MQVLGHADLGLHLHLRYLERLLPQADRWSWLDACQLVQERAAEVLGRPVTGRYRERAEELLAGARRLLPELLQRAVGAATQSG